MKLSVIAIIGFLSFPFAADSSSRTTDAEIASIVVTANQVVHLQVSSADDWNAARQVS